jgi:hypothetical protein
MHHQLLMHHRHEHVVKKMDYFLEPPSLPPEDLEPPQPASPKPEVSEKKVMAVGNPTAGIMTSSAPGSYPPGLSMGPGPVSLPMNHHHASMMSGGMGSGVAQGPPMVMKPEMMDIDPHAGAGMTSNHMAVHPHGPHLAHPGRFIFFRLQKVASHRATLGRSMELLFYMDIRRRFL